MRIIDLTRTITDLISTSPFDDMLSLTTYKTIENDGYADSRLDTSMHVGTHMDAPSHMIPGGKLMSDYPLEHFIAQGVALDFTNASQIELEDSDALKIPMHSIVIIHTNKQVDFGDDAYYNDYPVLTDKFVSLLIKQQVKAIILDSFSPDYAPFTIHKKLLKHDILIVENAVNTDKLLSLTHFEVNIMPLKIASEGAFVRAFVKIID
ncbi:MAG: cyclase family protein [Candidatus Izemoplasma sp.]|nr:cyclase family protein [Candidatus Izemoplasma sp.]